LAGFWLSWPPLLFFSFLSPLLSPLVAFYVCVVGPQKEQGILLLLRDGAGFLFLLLPLFLPSLAGFWYFPLYWFGLRLGSGRHER